MENKTTDNKIVLLREIDDEIINYCLAKQKDEKTMCVPFFEKEEDDINFLKTEIKYDRFIASYGENGKLNGILISSPNEKDDQILRLFAESEEIRESLIAELLKLAKDKKIVVYLNTSNTSNIVALEKFNFIKDGIDTSTKLFKDFNFVEENEIEAIRLNKDTIREFIPFMDKYFYNCYWNSEEILKKLDKRIIFGYRKDGIPIGVSHGVVYDDTLSEVMGIAKDLDEDYFYLLDHLINYLKAKTEATCVFCESEEEVKHLLEKGFIKVFESVFMEFNPSNAKRC